MTDPQASFNVELGRQIKARRQALNITQQRLAEYFGLTRSSVANIEAGRQPVSAFDAARAVQLLGVEMPGVPGVDDPLRAQLEEQAAESDRLRNLLRRIRGVVNSAIDEEVAS